MTYQEEEIGSRSAHLLSTVGRRPSTVSRNSCFLISAICGLFFLTSTFGQEAPEITSEVKAAIDKGLAFLAATQNPDGSWNDAKYTRATALSAAATLAFMSTGSTPGRGPYGKNAQRGLQYVLASSQPNGLLERGVPHHAMYSHGLSTLLLAEAWGMTGREDVGEKLKKAVDLIVKTQNNQGGWRYEPRPYDADISVTVMQVVALRGAQNAGVSLPQSTIDNAIKYVKKCHNNDGGFAYRPGGGSGFARTGAGVISLQLAGQYDAPEVKAGLDYLLRNKTRQDPWYYYAHYYAAQAMFQAGDKYWLNWYSFIRQELIKRQQENGCWKGREGTVVPTAFATMTLAVPYRYLPIYQR